METTTDKPKNKGGRPRKIVPVVDGNVARAVVAMPTSQEPESVYGWKVSEGFYRIQLFPNPGEGNKLSAVTFQCGEHPKVTLYKGKTHVVPGAVMHAIEDTVNMMPEDDLSDVQHPVRNFVAKTDYPHSEPIPATWQEYKAYRDAENLKPSSSEYARAKNRN